MRIVDLWKRLFWANNSDAAWTNEWASGTLTNALFTCVMRCERGGNVDRGGGSEAVTYSHSCGCR